MIHEACIGPDGIGTRPSVCRNYNFALFAGSASLQEVF